MIFYYDNVYLCILHVCVCVRACMFVLARVCVCVCLHARVCACVCVCMRVCVFMGVSAYVNM